MKLVFYSCLIAVLLGSCISIKRQQQQRANMQTLHYLQDYTGTDKYEVYQGSKDLESYPQVWVDTISKYIYMFSYREFYKFNFEGEKLGFLEGVPRTEIQSNGLITGYGISTWVLDGKQHTTKPKKITLSEENTIEEFEGYYKKAELVFKEDSSWILKIDEEFYGFTRNDAFYDNIYQYLKTPEAKSRFPLKEGVPRMVRLSRVNRFTLKEDYPLKIKDYVIKRTEKRNDPMVSSTFSDGDMHIELRMKNDTLNFKRGANDMGEGISLFQVPAKYGGNPDVMIICQEPDMNNQESKTGGFFIVRPKK